MNRKGRTRDYDCIMDRPLEGILFEELHPNLQKASRRLYRDGHFASAILEGCKALEEMVRRGTGLSLSGTQVMDAAMGGREPSLSVAVEPGLNGENEQQGCHRLAVGLMRALRNPKAHVIVDQRDPVRTLEYLGFSSVLMHRLDAAEVRPNHQPEGPKAG